MECIEAIQYRNIKIHINEDELAKSTWCDF